MSTSWTITCKKCGHVEYFHTGRSTDGAQGEEGRAERKAKNDPCPECKSTDRELGH